MIRWLPAFALCIVATLVWASVAWAHLDPVAPVVAALALILLAAKLGCDLASRVGQPAVLGELLAGVVLGSLNLFGYDRLAFMSHDTMIDMLTSLGVLPLLFEVGLESTVGQMMRVGLALHVGGRAIIDHTTYSAIVAMVILTTIAAPPALKWSFGRKHRAL